MEAATRRVVPVASSCRIEQVAIPGPRPGPAPGDGRARSRTQVPQLLVPQRPGRAHRVLDHDVAQPTRDDHPAQQGDPGVDPDAHAEVDRVPRDDPPGQDAAELGARGRARDVHHVVRRPGDEEPVPARAVLVPVPGVDEKLAARSVEGDATGVIVAVGAMAPLEAQRDEGLIAERPLLAPSGPDEGIAGVVDGDRPVRWPARRHTPRPCTRWRCPRWV